MEQVIIAVFLLVLGTFIFRASKNAPIPHAHRMVSEDARRQRDEIVAMYQRTYQ